MRTSRKLNTRLYGQLLAEALPVAVTTEAENERLLAVIEKLMSKGEAKLTPEEDTLLQLLVRLVEDFEHKAYPLPEVEPRKLVAWLLEERNLKPADLWDVLGSKGRVSDMLSGKREISKMQAAKLGAFFNFSAGMFIRDVPATPARPACIPRKGR